MQRYGAGIFRYCRDELRDEALAEDVQQQVFIAAFRDLPRFSRRTPVRTWLFTIARHRVHDAVRTRRRARAHVDSDDAIDLPDSRPSPGEQLDDAQLGAALIECLQKLRPRIVTALLLRFQQGLTFEEIAEVCGEKSTTLAATVARALPVLRACIEARTGRKL